jgi:Na+/H+ antiporter NhaD/arsenite permease-like protein
LEEFLRERNYLRLGSAIYTALIALGAAALLIGLGGVFALLPAEELTAAPQVEHSEAVTGDTVSQSIEPAENQAEAGGNAESEDTHGLHAAAEKMARELPLWTGIPFIGILLSIALFPLFAPHFWHHHFKKVSIAWALILAVPFLIAFKGTALFKIAEVMLLDYVPFIILLWGLYTVSGGILLRGALVGTPALNAQMMVIGMILASWMGTTGASMLMIRPMLRANAARKNKAHVFIFFTFLVSNIGGVLTPLGDPPLFLGFLHGVPFFWTMQLLPQFLTVAAGVLLVFFIVDSILYKKENGVPVEKKEQADKYPLRLEGMHNFLFLGGIITAVLISGVWKSGYTSIGSIHFEYRNLVRDLGILLMGYLSIRTTHPKVRQDNGFTWDAIKEVGYLFFGIFITIIPVLMILRAGVEGHFGFFIRKVSEPWHYFWMSGALSSFLDNAPTYLTFYNLALGQVGISEQTAAAILRGASHPLAHQFILFLKGVSCGAVFMGANSYIGNAPNFMVLSIAQENGVKMPSFFGYMIWSMCILLPMFLIVSLIFF